MFVVKVSGINGLGKTEGCEEAGNGILNALDEIYSNEQGKSAEKGSLEIGEIHVDNSNAEETNRLICQDALKIYPEKEKAIFIGGDHSVSYPLAKAFLEHCESEKKNPCLIVFDAHPDCMEAVRGSSGSDLPTHEDWLRSLIEAGFPGKNILLIGARNSDAQEIKFLKENKINLVPMNSFVEDFEGTCDYITEFSSLHGGELYVSIDIDILDPVFAPATGYREPGGLTSREFLYIVQRINKVKNLKAVDIVEINPKKDRDNLTVKLGAKILSEFL